MAAVAAAGLVAAVATVALVAEVAERVSAIAMSPQQGCTLALKPMSDFSCVEKPKKRAVAVTQRIVS